MLLAIDIDNRTTDFAVFDQDDLIDKFSITTDRNRSVVEIKLTIKLILMDKNIELSDINEIIISQENSLARSQFLSLLESRLV